MSTYVIGDVQGCYEQLKRLLEAVDYDPSQDRLCFLGDLINRGPDSLAVMQFVVDTPNTMTVLGNHDLHFLALVCSDKQAKPKDTLSALLADEQCDRYVDWLLKQPLAYLDKPHKALLVHAGLYPLWTIEQALQYAAEVQACLQDDEQRQAFFANMYGDVPAVWSESLSGWPRLRFITNALTRMRFVNRQAALELDTKGPPDSPPGQHMPWYAYPRQHPIAPYRVLFGHWAALQGQCDNPDCEALDGGCVWGHSLLALRLEDNRRFSVGERRT